MCRGCRPCAAPTRPPTRSKRRGSVRPSHEMGGHHLHFHGPADGSEANPDGRRLWIALALILGFMAVEVVVGSSPPPSRCSRTPPTCSPTPGRSPWRSSRRAWRGARRAGGFTFGMRRAEILSAQLNGATLLALGAVIVLEGVRRLISPPDVEGRRRDGGRVAGIAVNLAATMVLAGADRRSLNVEGAFQHVLTDLFAFIATAMAGVVILTTGFARADGDGRAVRGGADDQVRRGTAPRVGPGAARGRPARPRPGGDRARARVGAARGGGARPPRVGGHVGLPGAVGPRRGPRRAATPRRTGASWRCCCTRRFGIEHSTLQVEELPGGPLTIEPLPRAPGSA